MTSTYDPHDLQTWLTHYRLMHADLALICGVSERCVRFWVSGARPMPKTLLLLMQAVDDGRIDLDWLAGAIQPKREAA